MKKVIVNVWGKIFFLLFAMALHSCQGCGSSSPKDNLSGGGTSSSPINNASQTTKVDYQINLDDNKKVKEEGNKVYYEVPCGTDVKITAEITGPQKVAVKWMQTPSNVQGPTIYVIGSRGLNYEFHHHRTTKDGKVTSEESAEKTEYIWSFASGIPMSMTVAGKLSAMDGDKKDNNIVHNERIFVIDWK
jgi:hypothetical protein